MLLLLQVFGIFQNDIITNINNDQNSRRFEKSCALKSNGDIVEQINKMGNWVLRKNENVKFQTNRMLAYDRQAVYSRAYCAVRHELWHLQRLFSLHAPCTPGKGQNILLRRLPTPSQKLLHQKKLQKTNPPRSQILQRM
jgi:hypothetical protein